MRVVFSAGEPSGDAYAAALATEFRRAIPQAHFEGLVGPLAEAAGVEPIADSSNWGAIGVAEALKVYWRVRKGVKRGLTEMGRGEPGLFVPIDFGYANVHMAREAKKMGWKVLYFMPPRAYSRERQAEGLQGLVDAIVTAFPWSETALRAAGLPAFFFGHPLKEMVARITVSPDRQGVAVFPGSRLHELRLVLPAMAKGVSTLEGPIRVAVAPALGVDRVKRAWRESTRREAEFVVGEGHRLLKSAKVAAICSGTASLEAALCGCPSVICYRIPALGVLQAKVTGLRPRFIGLPNIVIERDAVPELLQSALTPEAVRSTLEPLLRGGEERGRQLAAFAEIDRALGESRCLAETGRIARNLLLGRRLDGTGNP